MRIVLSPSAVYAARLVMALTGCAIRDATLPHDPEFAWLRLGGHVFLFGMVALYGLFDFLGRRKRNEPGLIDSRAVLRSHEFWGPLAIVAVAMLLFRSAPPSVSRMYRDSVLWMLPLCLAMVGRRGYWDPIRPFVPTPHEERAVPS